MSKGLVSLAFKDASKVSPLRRERILRAADKLGYKPNFLAQSLATERSSFIGILLSNLHNPLFPEIADAARVVFEQAGRHSLLTSATGPGSTGAPRVDQQLIQMFQDLRPSGVLVIGSLAQDSALPLDTPVVYASSVPAGQAGGSSVRVHDHAGISLAVDHLIAQGRERIAFVGGEGGAVSQVRAQAYRDVLTGKGMDARVYPADLTERSGFEAFSKAVADGGRPDAVVAVNDLVGIGVQSAADQIGLRVPADLAVTGFDNTFLAGLHRISLTSVDPQNARVGAEAARTLLATMGGDHDLREELVEPRLVVRGSSS